MNENWETIPLELVASNKPFSFVGGPFGSDLQTKDYTEFGVRIIQLQNIGDGRFLDDYEIFTSREKADLLYRCNIFPGDIIIAKMADPIARACIIPDIEDRYLMASDGIRINVDANRYDATFVTYLINHPTFRDLATQKSTGSTRARIGLTELRQLPIKLPKHIDEQRKIARILSTVDAVIEKTEAAIAKHKAIKQGMMQDLFTRGLDKNGKLRPRYKDAPELYKKTELGWIPKEWEIIELGNLDYFDLATGGTPSTAVPEYWGGNIKWMSSGEVNKKRICEVDGLITQEGFRNSNATYYPINTVVIGLAGQGKTRATVAITYIETTSNQSIAGISCSSKYNPFFLYHLLDSQYDKLRGVSAGSGRAGLNLTILSKYAVLKPEKTEQDKLAAILESLDKVITKEQAEAEKLGRLKFSLMSVLLTGKVRVKYEEYSGVNNGSKN